MCCAFNMKAAEEIFKNKKLAKVVQALQLIDKNNSFDVVSVYEIFHFKNKCLADEIENNPN
jgi:hypothetical protein